MMVLSPTLRRIGIGGIVLALLAAVVLLVQWLGRGSAIPYKAQPQTVQMRLVELPPPPPPPPPPPEQKMVEVTKQPEFTEQPPQQEQQPQTAADEPPPGPLGLDVAGEGPGDGFALAGRPGGRDVLGSGGGSGGSRFGWYSALLQGRISQALQQQRVLYEARYEVPALIWVAADGAIERVELMESSGKPEIDRLLVRTIEAMPKLPQPPPQDMPQPIATRIRAS
jgi:protein TonB